MTSIRKHPVVGPQAVNHDVDMATKWAEFDSVPLFMRSLPSEDQDQDVSMQALQSLVHDGTPDEQAQNFKDQGNEYFRGRRYREALGFYTQGIDAQPDSTSIREALLANRAACNLELKNYGQVLRDTAVALQLNPVSSKAHYRAAVALLALEKLEEGLDCCDRCLRFDPTNSSVRGLRDKIARAKFEKDQRDAEKAERSRKEREERRIMTAAFQSLNIIVVPPPQGSRTTYAPHFDPIFSGLRTIATPVLFPVFLLYPQYNSSDFIQSFDPSATFLSHLEVMFPLGSGYRSGMSSGFSSPHSSLPGTPPTEVPMSPSWDITGEYTVGNLVVYASTHRQRVLKVGKRMTLRDVCDAVAGGSRNAQTGEKDGLELRDGCLSFYVIPKGEREREWVDEFKRKAAAGGSA